MHDIRDIWLYANNIIRSSRQIVNEELKPLNLTSAEGNIILHLLTQGEGFRQEDLVEELDISKPAVSRALEALEKKGFVTRKKDPLDKRFSRVMLTDRARDIGSQVEQVYNRVYATAAQDVSAEEIKGFIDLFGRVSDNFSKARGRMKRPGRPE